MSGYSEKFKTKRSGEVLPEIIKKEEVEKNEVYYSTEHETHGNKTISYYKFYDKEFNETREVVVRYTNAIEDLIEIVRVEKVDIMLSTVYKLTKLNEKFYKVEKTEDTNGMLEAICDNLKPKSWR